MIINLIGIVILLYSFVNYKKSFLIYLIYQVLWYYSATLFKIGHKTITISMTMNLIFFALYFIKGNVVCYPRHKHPYALPLFLMVFSSFLTCFFGVAGFALEFTRAINTISQEIILIWLIWYIVESDKDFKFLFKGITIVMLFACLFGILEYIIKTNIFIDIKNRVSDEVIRTYNVIQSATAQSRGYRITSVFEHSIGAGMNFGLYFCFVFIMVLKNRIKINDSKLAIITACLCVPCMLLTKMRSAMLFTLIALIGCIDLKNRKFYKLAVCFIVIAIIALPIYWKYVELFLSLFSSKYQNGVKGSTVDQRLSQLNAVYHLMKMSPIGGLGERFGDYISNQYTSAALEYESIWFDVMAKHGLIGIFSNFIMMIYSIIIIPKRYKSKEILFISLSYWITYTLTSIPSFRIHIYYLVIFYFIKKSEAYRNYNSSNYRMIKLQIYN